MKICILGAGAMGMLFGGLLSAKNEVWLLDVDESRIKKIDADGVCIHETDGVRVLHPQGVTGPEGLPEMDLVIVFVKAMYTEDALETNRRLLGPDTYLMTLQNGAGHEAKLLRFADRDHVILGSTQHNSSIIENGHVNHGGGGKTSIGLLDGNSASVSYIAENFTACGIDCITSDQIHRQIWSKLFINTAASSLTAVLQVPLGFILEDPYACKMMETLAREAVAVVNAEGTTHFDEAEVIEDIKELLRNAKGGYTSVYADVKKGARTEVDTISGSVVDAAHVLGVPVPCHEMVVALIHAMENKMRNDIN